MFDLIQSIQDSWNKYTIKMQKKDRLIFIHLEIRYKYLAWFLECIACNYNPGHISLFLMFTLHAKLSKGGFLKKKILGTTEVKPLNLLMTTVCNVR